MKTPTIATISVLIAGCSSISPPPPEPYDEKPNVKVEYFRESEWKQHADDVVVGSTDIDFSTIEIDYKIEKWEYFDIKSFDSEEISQAGFGHIRGWAFRSNDLKQIAFFTCM